MPQAATMEVEELRPAAPAPAPSTPLSFGRHSMMRSSLAPSSTSLQGQRRGAGQGEQGWWGG